MHDHDSMLTLFKILGVRDAYGNHHDRIKSGVSIVILVKEPIINHKSECISTAPA